MKRIISIAAALVLALSLLSACGGSGGEPAAESAPAPEAETEQAAEPVGTEEQPAETGQATSDNPWAGIDVSDEVHLTAYFVGTKDTDHNRVVDLANERMKELINTTVTIEIIPLSDFQTKYPLALAGGDDVDIIMTHPFIGPFSTHADNGAFYELSDEFLNIWMPETMKNQVPSSWKQAEYKGKLYQIPRNNSDYENTYGVVVLKSLREKYGITDIASIEDFEKYLYAVAEDTSDDVAGMAPLYAQPTVPLSLTFLSGPENWQTVAGAYWDADTSEVMNPDDIFLSALAPEYREYCLRMAEWAKRGVFPSDAITNVIHLTDLFKEGRSAADITMYKAGNADILDMRAKGIEAEYFNILPATASTRISPYNFDAVAITSFSQNPERAALAIDVMKNDATVTNLLQGGIEGEHYIYNEADNSHSNGPNYQNYAWSNWAWGLRSHLNPGEGGIEPSVAAIREKYDAANIDPARFPVDGFNFDNTGYEAESALINSLNQEWAASFDLGVFGDDTGAKLDEYIGLLKDAGIEKILEETKTQLKDFLAQQ